MNVQDLTDEQLQQMIDKLGEKEGDTSSQPQGEVSYVLPSGETLKGAPEQVNQVLLQKLKEKEQAAQMDNSQQAGYTTDQQQLEQYNFEKFQEAMVSRKDALEAIRYAFRTQAGFDPVEAMQTMGLIVTQLAQTVGDLNKTTAVSRLEGFENTPENVQTLEKIIETRGWARNPQSYEDALVIARSSGQIKSPQGGLPFQSGSQPLPSATQQDNVRMGYMPNIGTSSSEMFDTSSANGSVSPLMQKQIDGLSNDQLLSVIQELESRQTQ